MNNYDSVRLPPPPSKNGYQMGGEIITDIPFGVWIPAGQDFCIPGDIIRCGQNAFVRTIPLVTVPFTSFHIKFITFFTPLRILDEDGSKIITGFDENDDVFEGSFDSWKVSKDADLKKWSYYDYFTFQNVTKSVYDAIPEECKPADYWRKNLYRIYNEWLREPALQDEVDEGSNNDILFANYARDRYTAALLNPQLGAEATIGVEASNSVVFNDSYTSALGRIATKSDVNYVYTTPGGDQNNKLPKGSSLVTPYGGGNFALAADGNVSYIQSNRVRNEDSPYASNVGYSIREDSGSQSIYGLIPESDFVDYLNDNTLTINGGIGILDTRLAFAEQMRAEIMNKTGSRYNEYLKANFGIAPRDETLQRPVFLGSSQAPILVNEVTQTSETGSTPLGDIAGKGVTVTSSYTKRYVVKEFGIVQTLMAIVPDVYYSQGIPKKYTYKNKNDFFNRFYQGLGEVEIMNSEIFVNGTSHGDDPAEDGDNGTWGFEPIYEELRHPEKRICGAFRDELQNWTLARKFSERPALNGEFVQCRASRDNLNRIFVATDDTKFKPFHIHLYNDIRALRPIVKYPIGATLKGM